MTHEHIVHCGDAFLFRRAECQGWFCVCAEFVYSPFTLRF